MSTDLPDYYHILGLSCFEDNPEVIKTTVRQRAAYVRKTFAEEQPEACESLLEKMADAEAILLDSAQKAAYDADLRSSQSEYAPSGNASSNSLKTEEALEHSDDEALDQLVVPGQSQSQRTLGRAAAQGNHTWRLLFMIVFGGLIGIVSGIAILWFMFGRDPLGVVAWLNDPAEKQISIEQSPPNGSESQADGNQDSPPQSPSPPDTPRPENPPPSETPPATDSETPLTDQNTPSGNGTNQESGDSPSTPASEDSPSDPPEDPEPPLRGEEELTKLAESAAAQGDLTEAFKLVDELSLHGDIDAIDFKLRLLEKSQQSEQTPASFQILANSAMEIANAALDAERREQAMKIASLALQAARRSGDSNLVREVTLLVLKIQKNGSADSDRSNNNSNTSPN